MEKRRVKRTVVARDDVGAAKIGGVEGAQKRTECKRRLGMMQGR